MVKFKDFANILDVEQIKNDTILAHLVRLE
ncbi:MAG: hypothetical protein JWQ28_1901 [Pedobacter sp.]|jgi:hypothetical protein|nr:hypothetical protein [Pedobacter sp.]